MKQIFILILTFFIHNLIYSNPYDLHQLAKCYNSKNSEFILDVFESSIEDINNKDENGNTPVHVHLKYLIENLNINIDLNLLEFLSKNSDLFILNNSNENAFSIIMFELNNINRTYVENDIRVKFFAFLNIFLLDRWYLDFKNLGILKSFDCEYFYNYHFDNIILFKLNLIAKNIFIKNKNIYSSLKNILKYNLLQPKKNSFFLRHLYYYSRIINNYYDEMMDD